MQSIPHQNRSVPLSFAPFPPPHIQPQVFFSFIELQCLCFVTDLCFEASFTAGPAARFQFCSHYSLNATSVRHWCKQSEALKSHDVTGCTHNSKNGGLTCGGPRSRQRKKVEKKNPPKYTNMKTIGRNPKLKQDKDKFNSRRGTSETSRPKDKVTTSCVRRSSTPCEAGA